VGYPPVVVVSFALVFGWTLYALSLVQSGVRDGGVGDEGHRLVLAYRLLHDLSHIYESYLELPWPPLPYACQIVFHRALSLFTTITDHDFIRSVGFCSVLAYALHLLFAIGTLNAVGAPFGALIYVGAMLSSTALVSYATSSLAEPYALVFLSAAAFVLARGRNDLTTAVITGLLLLAATLCRVEVTFFASVIALLLLFRRGWLFATVVFVLSWSAFAFKSIREVAINFQGMSYLHLADYNNITGSVAGRFGEAFRAAIGFAAENRLSLIFLGLAAGIALLPDLRPDGRKRRPEPVSAPSPGKRFFLGSIVVTCASFAFILGLMLLGMTNPTPRYFSLVFATICFALSLGIGLRMSAPRNEDNDRLATITPRARTAAIALLSVALMLGNMSIVAETIPSEVRDGKNALLRLMKPGDAVFFDALLSWEAYIFAHVVIGADSSSSAMIYDMPLTDLHDYEGATLPPNVVRVLSYVDHFEPRYLVLAGPEWRRVLDSLPKFWGKGEAASYVLPAIRWESGGSGVLSLAGINSSKSFRIHRLFGNSKLEIYATEKLER